MARVLKCADLKKRTYLSYAIKCPFICLSITALSMSLLIEVQPGTASSELTYMTRTE
jgi:predicted transporter